MNNLQKALKAKAKCGLRMAAGGIIPQYDNTDFSLGTQNDLLSSFNRRFGIGQQEPVISPTTVSPSTTPPAISPTTVSPTPKPLASSPFDDKIGMSDAMAGLSNTDRDALLNPGNKPYKATDSIGGGSAQASMFGRRADALRSLRSLMPLQMADGGLITTIRNRNAAIEAAANADAPAPVAKPVAAPAPTGQAADYAAEAARLEAEQLAAARAAAAPAPKRGLLSRLGFAEGGIVRGRGTPTSDSVPMNISGQRVNLSNTEAVLPAKTVQALGGPAAVEHLIETTNGKPPVRGGLRSGGSYGIGQVVGDAADWVRSKLPTGTPATSPGVQLDPPNMGAEPAPMNGSPEAQAWKAQQAAQNAKFAGAATPPTPSAAQAAKTAAQELEAAATAKINLADVGNKVAEAARTVGAAPAKVVNYATKGLNAAGKFVAPVAAVLDVAQDPTATGIGQGAFDVAAGMGAKLGGSMLLPADIAARVTNNGRGLVQTLRDRFTGNYVPETAAAGTDQLLHLFGVDGPATPAVKNGVVTRRGISSTPVGHNPPPKATVPVGPTQMEAAVLNARSPSAAPEAPVVTPVVTPEQAQQAAQSDLTARSTLAAKEVANAQDAMQLPGGTLVQRGNAGLRSIAANPAVVDTLNRAHDTAGDGIRYDVNNGRTTISGTTPTKAQYVGADGKPTNNWYETQAYADSQTRAAKDKQLLDFYQRNDIEGDIKSPNPAYQERGLRRQAAYNQNAQTELARRNAESEIAFRTGQLLNQGRALDLQGRHYGIEEQQLGMQLAAAQRAAEQMKIEQQRSAREDQDKNDEQLRKRLGDYFTMKDDKNNTVEDKNAIEDFLRHANNTVTQEYATTKNPVFYDSIAGRVKGFADLDKGMQEHLINRYNAYKRWKESQSAWNPFYATQGDTMNLYDLDAEEKDGQLTFPRLEAKMKGKPFKANAKDFMYSEGPHAFYNVFQTPDDTRLRNLKSRGY